ncbi:helix-turn-helix domain-containing protein [Methylobacterium sp. J-076]|uniref:helix-turn-helix domain-containing protein n=1 Tax=Methylobacterium sp. J-076 TaxID=2836655 RepID=UPI00391CF5B0
MGRVGAGSPYCTHTRTRVSEGNRSGRPNPPQGHGVADHAGPHCLVPFDRREGLTTAEAAEQANRTERTIRMWCRDHDIGRHVAGGPWLVSKVALAMFLDGNDTALRAYLRGDRCSKLVRTYYDAVGLDGLIARWAGVAT